MKGDVFPCIMQEERISNCGDARFATAAAAVAQKQ